MLAIWSQQQKMSLIRWLLKQWLLSDFFTLLPFCLRKCNIILNIPVIWSSDTDMWCLSISSNNSLWFYCVLCTFIKYLHLSLLTFFLHIIGIVNGLPFYSSVTMYISSFNGMSFLFRTFITIFYKHPGS